MELALTIAGFFLAAVAATSIVLLRRHDRAVFLAEAARFGWRPSKLSRDEVLRRWNGLTLFDVGHTRRVDRVLESDGTGGRIHLFTYACETGFEHHRRLHRWIVLAVPFGDHPGPAVISRQDWLQVAARLPGRRMIAVAPKCAGGDEPAPATADPAQADHQLRAVVEDAERWGPALEGPPGKWLAVQPVTRSWEFLDGWLVMHEAGPATEETYRRIGDCLRDLGALGGLFNSAAPGRTAIATAVSAA